MKNLYISTSYKLYSVDGDKKVLEEETQENRPFVFISGMGFTLPKFEAEIAKLNTGDEYTIEMTPEEAYGERDENRIDEVSKEIMSVDGKFDENIVYEGAVVPLQNEEGAMFYGRITKVTEDKVTIDLNHPLAGKKLLFEGKVNTIREATNAELMSFVNAMNSETCGCGSCDGECTSSCSGDCGHCSCGCEDGCGGCGCH